MPNRYSLYGLNNDLDGAECAGPGPRQNFSYPGKLGKTLAVLLAVGIMFPGLVYTPSSAVAAEPEANNGVQAPLPQEKLDSLLAPIALYPDQLLMQILMASTYPLDVVAAARFVMENRDLKGDALDKEVMEKNWDPSVQSLTAFPQVLEMMNDKLEWTQELGDAFLSDERRVMDTIQRLREKADVAGNLKSNEQLKVIKQQQTIIIEPAQPEVIYVPSYNPTIIYGSWWAPAYPPYYYPPPPYYYPPGSLLAAGLIGFGIGMAISDNHWGWCHADWHHTSIKININRNNTFINNRPRYKDRVNNGNWRHNPEQRKGVAYRDVRTRDQYRRTDPAATASRRDARGYDNTGRVDSGDRTRDLGERSDRGRVGPSKETRDIPRGDSGRTSPSPSTGTRDILRGDSSRTGPSAGTRDVQRDSGDLNRGSRDMNRGSDTRPSFNAGQTRQQAQTYSNRGASSRASMGGGRGGSSSGGGGRR